jgi:F0F1-type ATP synthase alpha subunit
MEKKLALIIQGTIEELETDEVLGPTLYLHGNGSGSATELGQFTMHFEGVVHNISADVGIGVEGANFTVANGDKIFATNTGMGAPTSTAGVNKIVEKYTVTGGTGRYADASGSFTVERLVTLATGVSTGTIEGSIELH